VSPLIRSIRGSIEVATEKTSWVLVSLECDGSGKGLVSELIDISFTVAVARWVWPGPATFDIPGWLDCLLVLVDAGGGWNLKKVWTLLAEFVGPRSLTSIVASVGWQSIDICVSFSFKKPSMGSASNLKKGEHLLAQFDQDYLSDLCPSLE